MTCPYLSIGVCMSMTTVRRWSGQFTAEKRTRLVAVLSSVRTLRIEPGRPSYTVAMLKVSTASPP